MKTLNPVQLLKQMAKQFPPIRHVIAERDRLRGQVEQLHSILGQQEELQREKSRLLGENQVLRQEREDLLKPWLTWVPPGHFYSPIPDLDEVRANEQQLFENGSTSMAGIDLNEAEQLELLKTLKPFYDTQPFQAERADGLRYFFENVNYSYSDAIFLHCMIRHLKPQRIIEIGSGYSSCVTLDTNERFFSNAINCTFIEPYPDLLRSLLKPSDEDRITILPTRLQDVPLETFLTLKAGDILFIDSTHVSKIGSDVNCILFEILPAIQPGVYIHFHDIFYPFEYPKEWIYEGRSWNEAYVLRSFLQYNQQFKITLFNTFLEERHADWFHAEMPLCMRNKGGSLWLTKHDHQR